MWGYSTFYSHRCGDLLRRGGIVPEQLQSAVCEHVSKRVADIARRSQIVDFHQWRSNRGYEPDSQSHVALDAYKSQWCQPIDYIKYLHAKFPELGRLSATITRNSVAFAETVISHWKSDMHELVEAEFIPENTELTRWEFLFEESHHHGAGTVHIHWVCGDNCGDLIYKPRPADGEQLLQYVFSLISIPGEEFIPRTLDCDEYSWHEYIPRQAVTQPELYLRRCGKALAVCGLLGSTDLHADNIRPGPSNCPVIVDGETAVQLRPATGREIGSWELFSSGLIPTTMGAPLLAAYGGLSGDQGLGPSLEQHYIAFELKDPDSDAVSLRRTSRSLRVAPLNNQEPFFKSEAKRALIQEGFVDAIQALQAVPNLGHHLDSKTRGMTFRQVIRGTNAYFALLTAATDPQCLAERSPSPFQLLEPKSSRILSLFDAVAQSEINQLCRADVPYFELSVDEDGHCWIEADDGMRIDTREFGYEASLNLRARAAWLLNLSVNQIRSALNINDSTLGLEVDSPEIDDIGEYLRDTRADDVPHWLWVDTSSPERLRLVPGGVSLLGSLGCAHAIGRLEQALDIVREQTTSAELRWFTWGSESSSCVALGFNGDQKRKWHDDLPNLIAMGKTGDYLTGILGFLAHIPVAWRSKEVTQLVLNAQVEREDGLAHGQAGLFAAAMAVGCEFGPTLGADICQRLRTARSFDELAWCRGTTGVVAALAACGFLSSEQADDYVKSVAQIVSAIWDSANTVDFSFCHGLTGFVAVLDLLRACGHKDAGVLAQMLRAKISISLAEGRGYYLAHPAVKEDPGFLNGYGSIALILNRVGLHPLLPPIRKEARHALG